MFRDGKATLVDEGQLLDRITALMPAVTRELERLRENAKELRPIFAAIHRRAWSPDLGYDRYLPRN